MKHNLQNHRSAFISILFLLFITKVSFGQSQSAMNESAGKQYKKADLELNVVYQNILKTYASQPLFIKNLKVAQRLWLQLRNAELAAKYPNIDDYGSALPMCKSIYLEKLTRDRTKFLKTWIDGIPEGDVCSGSVKMKR